MPRAKKTAKSPSVPRAEWEQRLRKWRKSGLAIKDFAIQEGISVENFKWWRWRIEGRLEASPCSSKAAATKSRRRSTQRSSHQPTLSNEGSGPAISFIELSPTEVLMSGAPKDTQRFEACEVEINLTKGRCVRLSSQCNPRWVAELIHALEENA